jgi:hypothetical protein
MARRNNPTDLTTQEQEALQTLYAFLSLMEVQNKVEASEFLSDDLKWTTPSSTFNGKRDWLDNFREADRKPPIFDDPPVLNSEDNGSTIITRKGKKKKVGYITINILKTVEVNQEGKICKLEVARA